MESKYRRVSTHTHGTLALYYHANWPETLIRQHIRYIPWIYVGISTRTAISVLRQYLDVVSETGYILHVIRSDMGSETHMMAGAHCALHETVTNMSSEELFPKIFWYGRSIDNIRVESWWRQLSKS
jgi:hypothetical protein